jgi:exopolysaccharide biosynthesis polyprenyl glycosylphosphotransferase
VSTFVIYDRSWTHAAWGLLAIPVWLVLCSAYGLYGQDIRRISHSTVDDVPRLAHSLLIACLLLWLYYHLVPAGKLHFKYILVIGACTLVTSLALRAAARRRIRLRLGPERVLLIGADEAAGIVARKLADHPEYGAQVVGLVRTGSDAAVPGEGPLAGVPCIGSAEGLDLAAVAAEHGVHRIVVSQDYMDGEELSALVRQAQEVGVKIAVVPQLLDSIGPSVQIDHVEGTTLFGVYPPVLDRPSRMLKRAMDIAGALLLLIVAAPLMIAIAIAIKLDSPGTVLFRQRRVGRGGRPFHVVKFRTMHTDAEKRAAELLGSSTDPEWLLLENDPRITRVGRLLRGSSLDELPQAWNVLKGEMSLVGPRPLIESEDRKIMGWGRSRVDLAPGLTGLWQVLGRTNISFRDMVALDYLYVTNWSLWGDVKLLLSTIPVVLSQRGAN